MYQEFFVACWRLCESLVGVISVVGGCLVREPPKNVYSELCARQGELCVRGNVCDWAGMRAFWSEWLPTMRKVSVFII